MKLWADFYDYLLPDVPECPYIAATFALRQSAILFCQQSLAWTYEHPVISVTVDTDEYNYAPPFDALVHTILHAEFNDLEIDAKTKQSDIPIWNWRHQAGTPKYILGEATSLKLVPTPDVEGTLNLTVALKPVDNALSIDDDIFAEYREAIVHGAKARLMLSPKKPYSNPELAAFHQHEFLVKTGAASARAARNHTTAPLRTTIMRRR